MVAAETWHHRTDGEAAVATRWPAQPIATKLYSRVRQDRENGNGIRRFDVFYRICDPGDGIRPGPRSAGVRVGVGARTFAHSDLAQIALARRWGVAEGIPRGDGSVRVADRGSSRDKEVKRRDRCVPGSAARPYPDGKTRRLDRPDFGRAVSVRHRNAEEMADHGTEFRARFKLMRERIAAMKALWTKTKAEYHGEWSIFRNDGVAKTGPEAAPAGHPRQRLSSCGPACARLWRWLDPARQPTAIRRHHRVFAALSADGSRSRARRFSGPGNDLGGAGRSGSAAPPS